MTKIEKYEESFRLSRKELIVNNFFGGIAWAIGATIGLSLVLAILSFIAQQINVIPFIGTFISQIIDFVLKNNQSIH